MKVLAFLRKLFEIERLPPAPSGVQRQTRQTSWVALLLTPESLLPAETQAAPPRRGPGFLRQLVAPEPLPPPPPPQPRAERSSWLRLLLAPEPLPTPPPHAPRPRQAGWLAWLFAPEKLDKDSK